MPKTLPAEVPLRADSAPCAAAWLPKPGWLLALAIFSVSAALPGQTREWVWMGGQSTFAWNSPGFTIDGVFGTQGAFAPGNLPGVRNGAVTWTDKNGNLWLFGGAGYGTEGARGQSTFGMLNDLWEFNPSTNEWAFIKGSAEGGRDCTFLQTDTSSEFYCGTSGVYGKKGVSAAANTPGSRELAVGWTDADGKLWLFGGLGFDPRFGVGYFNDLWMFDPAAREWTWVGGDSALPGNLEGQRGKYGTQGTAAAGNLPGGRSNASACTDAKGDFWLFGGLGVPATGSAAYGLNDLWKYNPTTREWTWVSGSDEGGRFGEYGRKGVGSKQNFPGSRSSAACWVDNNGALWLFGGDGLASNGNTFLNDFWKFSPSSSEWTWVGGNSTVDFGYFGPPGVWGSLGQGGTAFIPSGRYEAASFTDLKGNLWLFGGRGVDSSKELGDMNDLWMFDPSNRQWTWMSGSKLNHYQYFGVGGTYGVLGEPGRADTPGGRDLAAAWTDRAGNFWLFGGEGTGAGLETIGDAPNDLWEYRPASSAHSITPAPKFSVAAGSYSEEQTVAISAATSDAAIYFSTDASSSAPMWSAYKAPVAVTASETLTAVAIAPGMWPSVPQRAAYELPAETPSILLSSGTYDAATVKITDATPGAVIYYTTDNTAPTVHSTVYSGQIAVSASETISAMAAAPGNLDSAVASATYAISSQAAATNHWTWMGGSSTFGKTENAQPGVYGNKGSAASGNIPGGREAAAGWTDKSGKMWLFGGYGVDSQGFLGYLNDLWQLDPTTGEWAWMNGSSSIAGRQGFPGVYGTKGQFAPGNYPGSREFAATWVDKQGDFWLFGGFGFDGNPSGFELSLNDLWEFSPAKGQWAWIAGPAVAKCPNNEPGSCPQRSIYGMHGVGAPANTPGSRAETTSWVDAQGNFWLFGGSGVDVNGNVGDLDELWEFKPAEKVWVWMGGQKTVGPRGGQPGVYGERDVSHAGNHPGGRLAAAGWTDAGGNLWLFGGGGFDALEENGQMNDLWKYSPATGLWTWIGGSNLVGIDDLLPGTYGILGVSSGANSPGGRYPGQVWVDKAGNPWLLGGYGSAAGPLGDLNDLWEFNGKTHDWTWMSGSDRTIVVDTLLDYGVPGTYGAMHTAAAGNTPGGREDMVGWTDLNGNLWLFGGWGNDSVGEIGYLNDVWKFQPVPPAAAASER